MEANPFTQKYNDLSSAIGHKNNEQRILVDELTWFDNTDINNLQSLLDEEENTKKTISHILTTLKRR